MRSVLGIISLLWLVIIVQACQQKQQENTDSDSLGITNASVDNTRISEQLTALGLSEQGQWRGIALGDSITKVKAIEKGELFERDAKHLGYSVEFPNLESMDVLYYQDGKQLVSGIEVDLYLNSGESVARYKNDLADYFTSRYGKPSVAGSELRWVGPKQEKISLKDVSKAKDFGLKVKISEEG